MDRGRMGPRGGRDWGRGISPSMTNHGTYDNIMLHAPTNVKSDIPTRGREPSRRARGMAQGTATRPSDRLHIGAGCGMNREAIPGTSQRRELHPGEPSIGKKEDRLSNERFIGVQQLKELCNLDPEILIQHIIIESNGFFGLLHTNGLSSEACKLILQIVHSASTCQEVPSTKIKLLSELKNSKFLRSELSRYLVMLTTKENVCKLKESLLYSLSIMEVLLTCMPSSLPDVMVLYGTFEMVYRHYKDKSGSSSEAAAIENHMITVSILIKDLAEARRKNSKTSRYSREDGASPPDDFRKISIFPQLKDIHLNETPFLRANKDKGGYKDLNHYLDVQFRLMREDLVAPLRDGIFEFKSSGERGNKYKDIRLYYDVKVLYPVCTPKGMLHQIRFNTSRLRKVKWEVSKRLIYGSLLCLSKDNFTTLCFATVAEREPPDLVKGILYVKFECDQQMTDGISTDDIFLMAETSAYFESYRHVLRGLQSVGDDMPFQKYIVYCDNNVEPPSYLRRNQKAVYDLKPLIYQDSKVAIKDTDTDDSTDVEHQSIATVESNESDDDFGFWLSTKTDNNIEDNTVSFTNVASAEFLDSGDFSLAHAENINSSRGIQDTKLKSEVEVLDIACWPSGEQLHLDKSQLLAVQCALTKEFVVIQGPPGTGKTYVGLEVVKLLLHNRDIWSREGERPLLVVCYTNHALDQFLEGIQQFHDSGIIRIGTRSQSKVLEKYFLKNVRKAEQYFIPVEIRQGLSDSQSIIDRLEATMNENSFLLEATEIGVLHEDVLEPYMHESHYHQLTLKMPSKLQHRKSRCKIKSLMKEWLNCGSTVVHGPLYDDTAFESAGQEDSENFDEGVDIEGDAAFEEAQRRLDDDDSKYNESKGALEGVTRPKRAMDRHARMKIEDDVLAIKANSFHTDTQNLELGCKDDWYIGTKEKERRKRMLKEELKKVTHMTYQEADLVTNIWKMPLVQRWQLYRYWINAYKSKIRGKIVEIERQYLDEHERLNGLKQRESLELMQNATILGMTTTGAAQHWQVLQKVAPRIIIVEEAAEVMESHIVTTLSHGCEHLILIGDPTQQSIILQ